MRDKVVGFNEDQARCFCTHLWNGLTIVGRAVWSDPDASIAAQRDGLKRLNEMQHRVCGALRERTRGLDLRWPRLWRKRVRG